MGRVKAKGPLSPVWIYFCSLLAGNSLLSYFPISAQVGGWVFSILIFLPVLLRLVGKTTPGSTPLPQSEIFPNGKGSRLLILPVVFLAIFLRFFHLTDFHLWPTGDEALHGFLALQLLPKWDWQFFYTVGEHPPLLIWVLSFFFRWFNSPFFDLWFLPAFFSILVAPAGYLAARVFLSKSISALFGTLLALSFWPLYFGRFCHQGLFTPALELLCFWILALWVKDPKKKKAIYLLCLLAFLLGIGSLTFTAWATVLLLVTTTVLVLAISKDKRQALIFLSSLTLALSPFLWAIWNEGYGRHLIDSAGAESPFTWQHHLLTHISYLSSLFWGSLQAGTSYGPTWGGMLNPVFSSAFFIGLSGLWPHRREGLVQWIGAAFFVCFLPGFLAADYVELNRVIQVMPLLLLVTTLGLGELALAIGKVERRKWIVGGLVLCGLLLDLNHLLKPVLEGSFANPRFKQEIPDANFRAYRILEKIAKEKGPGMVLTEFLPLRYGHSLYVATYPFNVAANLKLDIANATWVAVPTNIDYQPFLSKRFPKAKWYWVDNDLSAPEGGMMIGIIPFERENQPGFQKWLLAHQIFHKLQVDAEGSFNSEKKFKQSFQDLAAAYPLVQGDPFLESCYWEWTSQYYFGPTKEKNIQALQNAIQRGYPVACFYQQLTVLLEGDGHIEEALKAKEKAVKVKSSFIIESDSMIRVAGN